MIIKNIILFAFLVSTLPSFSQTVNIEIEIKGVENKQVFLAHHYGLGHIIVDSILLNQSSKGLFKSKEKLPEGVYMIILPDTSYFDFIIDNDQRFALKNDIKNLSLHFESEGSNANELMGNYQRLAIDIKNKQKSIQVKMQLGKIKERNGIYSLDSLTQIINLERNEIIKNNPNSLIASLLNAISEPEIPTAIEEKGEEWAYQYYKNHYFDNINFRDERLLLSPIILNKINHFFNYLIEWHPDSVIKHSFKIIDSSSVSLEIYKTVINHLLLNFDKNGSFSHDEAFVAIANEYYLAGKTPWVSQPVLDVIEKRKKMVEPTLKGTIIPKTEFVDSASNPIDIMTLTFDYAIILFWNPDCEHCQSAYIQLKDFVEKYADYNIKIITILTGEDTVLWKEFIRKHNASFIQLRTVKKPEIALEKWDLYMNPRILIIDKEHKIYLKDPEINNIKNYLNL